MARLNTARAKALSWQWTTLLRSFANIKTALSRCFCLTPDNVIGLMLAAFCWGGVTHILTDAMTVSGVPWSPYSTRRFHLFGGRFRTGDPVEYAISAAVVVCCIGLMQLMPNGNFAPFFYNWSALYESGVIDAHEWRTNRFRIF